MCKRDDPTKDIPVIHPSCSVDGAFVCALCLGGMLILLILAVIFG